LTSKEAKMRKVMRHTLGASLNIRHNLSSSKGPKPLQLKLLTTYIPKTSAFTLAFSTSQRLRTTRASASTLCTDRHSTNHPAHNLSSSEGPKPLQLNLLTTYIPKTRAFTLAFSTSQRLRTTRASARTFFTFRHYITPSARNF